MIKDIYVLYDNYFIDIFSEGWGVWDKIDKDWIRDILDENNEEYDDETIDDLLDLLLQSQDDIQTEYKDEEASDLMQTIEDSISQTISHLEYKDIGRILVKIANEYLNEY